MNEETRSAPISLRIAAVSILAALTFVLGFVAKIPLPVTKGVLTLADVIIFFAAFAFGPFTAAIAGGVGAVLIDLIGGFAQFAPTSLVVHGTEGLIAGLIAAAAYQKKSEVLAWIIAGVCGVAILVGGYFLAELIFYGGLATASWEVLPNMFQGVFGAICGSLLARGIRRAYPPIQVLRW
jgi:uncharacterized membrane protein